MSSPPPLPPLPPRKWFPLPVAWWVASRPVWCGPEVGLLGVVSPLPPCGMVWVLVHASWLETAAEIFEAFTGTQSLAWLESSPILRAALLRYSNLQACSDPEKAAKSWQPPPLT